MEQSILWPGLRSGVSYDASGDVLSYTDAPKGAMSYTYDAESRATSVSVGGTLAAKYVYDASGARVAKLTSTDAVTAVYVQGPGGVYAEPAETWASFPFGESVSGLSTEVTTDHFTGKERDIESGLDYFGARYLASSMGRFVSPDWSAGPSTVPYAKLTNPQTLNLYAYVGNNPMTLVDRDGHCDWCQKIKNKIMGKGYKTDEQVATKGWNHNVVLVATKVVREEGTGVTVVTWTPYKLKDGKLAGPLSKNPDDPNVKVTLWESRGGESYDYQSPPNGSSGHADDHILTGDPSGVSTPVTDQHWSVNGERVQVALGKDSSGKLKLSWQPHIDRSHQEGPVYSDGAKTSE